MQFGRIPRVPLFRLTASPVAPVVHKEQGTYQQGKQLGQGWPFHILSC